MKSATRGSAAPTGTRRSRRSAQPSARRARIDAARVADAIVGIARLQKPAPALSRCVRVTARASVSSEARAKEAFMRRIIPLALVALLTVGLAAPVAEAYHGSPGIVIGTAVGLALAAPFLIVGSLLAPLAVPPVPYRYPAVVESPVVAPPAYSAPAYAAPAYAAPAPVPSRAVALQSTPRSYATVVEYPHGRYVLRGDGIHVAYRWVWIPNAPAPPAYERQTAARY
jgi:hypothetical protein